MSEKNQAATLSLFLKENKLEKQPVQYPATRFLVDPETGKPVLWTIRPLTTAQNDKLRDGCTREVQVPGRKNQVRLQVDQSLYMARMLAASIEYPNLHDAALQDSYGVKDPEDLVRAMVDEPGEYQAFVAYVTEYQGFKDLQDEVDEAKNS